MFSWCSESPKGISGFSKEIKLIKGTIASTVFPGVSSNGSGDPKRSLTQLSCAHTQISSVAL